MAHESGSISDPEIQLPRRLAEFELDGACKHEAVGKRVIYVPDQLHFTLKGIRTDVTGALVLPEQPAFDGRFVFGALAQITLTIVSALVQRRLAESPAA